MKRLIRKILNESISESEMENFVEDRSKGGGINTELIIKNDK